MGDNEKDRRHNTDQQAMHAGQRAGSGSFSSVRQIYTSKADFQEIIFEFFLLNCVPYARGKASAEIYWIFVKRVCVRNLFTSEFLHTELALVIHCVSAPARASVR